MKSKEKHTEDWTAQMTDWAETGHEWPDEDLELLLRHKEAVDACQDMMNMKNALAQVEDADKLDVEEEWRKFESRISSKEEAPVKPRPPFRFIWGVVSGVAASLLLFLAWSWYSDMPDVSRKEVAKNMPVNKVISQPKSALSVSKRGTASHPFLIQSSAASSVAKVTIRPASSADSAALLASHVSVPVVRGEERMEAETVSAADKQEMARLESSVVKTNTITIPRGKDYKLTLADGTIVWMNANSRLIYPSEFEGGERRVALEGEAYFKVKKDAAHPFIIMTKRLQAKVLGTELYVCATARKSHVALINGKVEVSNGTSSFHLHPGQDATLRQNGKLSVENIDTDYYTYWRDGYYYFDNETLIQVMQTLSDWYNVNVVFENERAAHTRIQFFNRRHDSIREVVKSLNNLNAFEVRIQGNTLYVN